MIGFFAPVDPDGCFFCCSSLCRNNPTPTPVFDSAGRRVYERQSGRFLLVVEARPGANFRQPGTTVFHSSCVAGQQGTCTGAPDLQVLVDRDLGDGSAAVCDVGANGGGVPGTPDLAFTSDPAVLDALNDIGCRFETHITGSDACTRNEFGLFAFQDPQTTRQYCMLVPLIAEFPPGDTVVAVQVRDIFGTPGPREEIVVRVQH